jgi:hypothetical protein
VRVLFGDEGKSASERSSIQPRPFFSGEGDYGRKGREAQGKEGSYTEDTEREHRGHRGWRRLLIESARVLNRRDQLRQMCRTETKPLTEEDRARLLESLPKTPPWYRGNGLHLVAYGCAALIVLPIVALMISDVGWQPRSIVLGVVVAFIVGIAVYRLVLKPMAAFRRKDAVVQALREKVRTAETAQVQRVVASEVVEIESPEGNFYLFSTDENECVWVQPEQACQDWPNSSFEMVKMPGLDREFRPFCDGALLKPKKRVRFSTYFEHFDFDQLPEDGVIAQSAEAFLQAARNSGKTAVKGE